MRDINIIVTIDGSRSSQLKTSKDSYINATVHACINSIEIFETTERNERMSF